jgi:hypothetical protein
MGEGQGEGALPDNSILPGNSDGCPAIHFGNFLVWVIVSRFA